MTERLRVSAIAPDPTAIARAAATIRAGHLVAFPTETVYGLGAHALDRAAVRRIFEAKGRPSTDPLIVHVLDADAARRLMRRCPDGFEALARQFWPGPLTLIVPRTSSVPDEVTAGLDTVALRAPSHPVARAILREAGVPIAAPSANLFSRPSPTTAEHVLQDLDGRIDIVVDGGATTVGVESTVLDLTESPAVILRPGAIGLEAIRTVLPDVCVRQVVASGETAVVSPGVLVRHYSPRTPLVLFDARREDALAALATACARAATEERSAVLLVFDGDADALRVPGTPIVSLGNEHNAAHVAARLYGALRDCDRLGRDVILCRAPAPDASHPLWTAIADRLRRAAATEG